MPAGPNATVQSYSSVTLTLTREEAVSLRHKVQIIYAHLLQEGNHGLCDALDHSVPEGGKWHPSTTPLNVLHSTILLTPMNLRILSVTLKRKPSPRDFCALRPGTSP